MKGAHIHFVILVHLIATAAAGFSFPFRSKKRLATKIQNSKESSTIELETYLQPKFKDKAARLSPESIVEMIDRSTPSTKPLRQQIFTSPFISTLYERILPPLWEAGLRIGGPDAEYQAARKFLCSATNSQESKEPRVLLDMCCGTGFVASRFANENSYDHVFALDYSFQMLGELVASIRREDTAKNSKALPLSIIRGDAGNLPFCDSSIDDIHFGAALHCVPDPSKAMQEVHRVLKDGGNLYLTTFLRPFPDVVFQFFTVEDLESLALQSGFAKNQVTTQAKGVYGVLLAKK